MANIIDRAVPDDFLTIEYNIGIPAAVYANLKGPVPEEVCDAIAKEYGFTDYVVRRRHDGTVIISRSVTNMIISTYEPGPIDDLPFQEAVMRLVDNVTIVPHPPLAEEFTKIPDEMIITSRRTGISRTSAGFTSADLRGAVGVRIKINFFFISIVDLCLNPYLVSAEKLPSYVTACVAIDEISIATGRGYNSVSPQGMIDRFRNAERMAIFYERSDIVKECRDAAAAFVDLPGPKDIARSVRQGARDYTSATKKKVVEEASDYYDKLKNRVVISASSSLTTYVMVKLASRFPSAGGIATALTNKLGKGGVSIRSMSSTLQSSFARFFSSKLPSLIVIPTATYDYFNAITGGQPSGGRGEMM